MVNAKLSTKPFLEIILLFLLDNYVDLGVAAQPMQTGKRHLVCVGGHMQINHIYIYSYEYEPLAQEVHANREVANS